MGRSEKNYRYISLFGAWALAYGCSVGWGSFVMPGTTFLPIAGPMGTVLGIVLGAIIMLIIGVNYHYMMNRYPDEGGVFSYTKRLLGYDHGFLSAWFLVLTYVAILWANLTALALIGRNLLGSIFQVGFHYRIAGFDIYFGEIALALSALVITGLVCIFAKRLSIVIQIIMATLLFGGVVACFVAVSMKTGDLQPLLTPAYAKTGAPVRQIFSIAALTPWAFVGFESISHSTAEFRFSTKKSVRVLTAAIATGLVTYVVLAVVAALAVPSGYDSWASYLADLSNQNGLSSLPTFFAIHKNMGNIGLAIAGIAVLGGIITGLVGNYIAASRLMCAMADDEILPVWFARKNKEGTPHHAVLFIMLISMVIPFLGRTAISWIVDVTTIGATIAYAYASACAYKAAKEDKKRALKFTGAVGFVMSILFLLHFLIPTFWSVDALATESFLILTFWSIIGFAFFRQVLQSDHDRRFGHSSIVWIVLSFLIIYTSTIWMKQTTQGITERICHEVQHDYIEHLNENSVFLIDSVKTKALDYLATQLNNLNRSILTINLLQMGLIVFALIVLCSVLTLMSKRERENESVRALALKDALTGVQNKHAYQQMETFLNREIAKKSINAFAVAVLDVNGLKRVNDTLGHTAGDEYIRSACSVICDTFVHSPVFRIGGDEFTVVLRGRDFENYQELVEYIHVYNDRNKGTGAVTMAIGISEFVQDKDCAVADVFARADEQMYRCKREQKAERV